MPRKLYAIRFRPRGRRSTVTWKRLADSAGQARAQVRPVIEREYGGGTIESVRLAK